MVTLTLVTGIALFASIYGIYFMVTTTIEVNNLEKRYEKNLYKAFARTIETFQLSTELKQKLNKSFQR